MILQTGILDVSNVVYYLTVIGLFLFFTVQSIQKEKMELKGGDRS